MELSSSTNLHLPCRLCWASAHPWARSIHGVGYEWCAQCGAIQRTSTELPDPETEIARYHEHNNQPDNANYRAYLQRFIDSAILPSVPASGHILDFGSGPYPVLSTMLRAHGFSVTSYDPFFLNDDTVWNAMSSHEARYDAIVLLEVIEHLHHPREELQRLLTMLQPQGRLILRTGVFDARDPADDIAVQEAAHAPSAGDAPPTGNGPAAERFLAWWYRRDPTHVVFLTPRTIAWLETRYSLRLIHHAPGNELVFQRKDDN